MAIRILLADDSAFWREQIGAILEEEPGWTVFQATNGAEAVERSAQVQPDAIVLDMCMPILDGLGAARQLRSVSPGVPVVMVTVDKSALLEVLARQAGVLAVFPKMDCLELRNFLKRTVSTRAA